MGVKSPPLTSFLLYKYPPKLSPMASSNSDKKIIVVVGATGNQGSSVAHTFLELPDWHVRCVTRNPSSPASQSLSSLGAEVVKADLADLLSLKQAFQNANAIFVNTDFWEIFRAPHNSDIPEADRSKLAFDQEVLHGKNAAIAAASIPSLERFVYSALPPMAKYSKGKYARSYHAESKATIVEYIETEQPQLAKKTSIIYLGVYNTNAFVTPRFDPASGKFKYILPLKSETKLPIVDAKETTGPLVRALVEDEAPGTKLLAYDTDSNLSVAEIANLWARVSGRETEVVEVSLETMHKQFGIPMELLDSPGFIAEFGYLSCVDGHIEPPQLKRELVTKSFEKWLEERDWKEILESTGASAQK